jgi:hypothetical protein
MEDNAVDHGTGIGWPFNQPDDQATTRKRAGGSSFSQAFFFYLNNIANLRLH